MSGHIASALRRLSFGCLALAFAFASGCGGDAHERSEADAALLHRILEAEDARAPDAEALDTLFEGLASTSPEVRRIAVRALGRLERDDLTDRIAPLLDDGEPAVRSEAANALAQAVYRTDGTTVRDLLTSRLHEEAHPATAGALARSLGRVRLADAGEARSAALALASAEVDPVGIVAGLYLLARQSVARGALPDEVLERLRELARTGLADPGVAPGDGAELAAPAPQRIRTLAIATLATAAQATPDDLERALSDPDPLVRREAIVGSPALGPEARRELLLRGLADDSPIVRAEAVTAWGRIAGPADCEPLRGAAASRDLREAVPATARLGACAAEAETLDLLEELVAGSPPGPVQGRAIVALARLSPSRAAPLLAGIAEADAPLLRAQAAAAAGALRSMEILRALAGDPEPVVRVPALQQLSAIEGRAADDRLVAALASDDPLILMTSSRLLAGTSHPDANPSLLDALARVSALRRETSRDARMAILERIGETGTAADSSRILVLLEDFDPAVAARAAELLEEWTGTARTPSPRPLPRAPVPTPSELDLLDRTTAVFEFADGTSFTVRLRAWDAPTNAARFARLVRAGHFDGLTFHRVVPNFVIQGGSPAAHEYAGDGPYTRDELGLDGNWRGTVGLSTRGRDTGDGQIFVNLVDNIRLDHNYTVFAEVVEGMDAVDAAGEGVVIRRVRLAVPEQEERSGVPSSSDPEAIPATRNPDAPRIVAFGDVHGDLAATRGALRLAGAIDENDRWIGGDLVVVQTGDQLDRGDDERAILDLFARLVVEGREAGGAFHPLNGNHELMNAHLDLRYITEGGFRDFEGAVEVPDPGLFLPDSAMADSLLARYEPEERARVAAFRPGGPYALLLARRNTIVMVGDNVFVHGGVLPEHAEYGIEAINEEIRAWLRGEAPAPEWSRGSESPIWTRLFSRSPDEAACEVLGRTLETLGARRMIVGHTVHRQGITPYCDERVWAADVGMASYYGGPLEVLEIRGDSVRVLGR